MVQSTQYYPFGMPFADAMGAGVQPYKYNNKELDGRNGLNWYDYSARYLALDFPVMPMVDPMAEKFYSISPYVYCYNNPLKYIDPDGKAPMGGPIILGGPVFWTHRSKIGNALASVLGMKDLFTLTTAFLEPISGKPAATFDFTDNGIEFTPVSANDVENSKNAILIPGVSGKGLGKAAQMTENAAKGKAFEKQVGESLGNSKASQVTIEVADGTRTKVDFVQKNDGKVTLTEAKGSQTAPLTPNQKKAHPQIEQSGGTVRGNKGSTVGLPNGEKIPPTKVEIIRPKDLENR